ncbi:HlyD family secretion protein [Sphingobacterium bovisgrunnientis]|uniref:HlyD family secretion protein n=1 Tax=Sphingobacterium bovisgrunnientis TaxID=1874697 RepID=UPI0013592971|nr:HlyD family efflux transporter periplasmic adaptor subunit [Sphingobacterium bovisgrunnientis]
MAKFSIQEQDLHSEDLQEIIAKPPTWLMKRGISFILLTILMILSISVFIKYPEVVNTNLKFNTTNAPKVMLSKINGNLVNILVQEGAWVSQDQEIAYMESIADHKQVLSIVTHLKNLRTNKEMKLDLDKLGSPGELELGELQNSYQNFYLAYLNYQAVKDGGIFEKRKQLIYNELSNVNEQNERIQKSYELQQQELALAEQEFKRYKALADKKIISPLELQQKEAALLAKKQALPQIENNIISNRGNLLSKDKELSEINNQIFEEEKKFVQSFNSFISEADNWKKKYVISSPSEGYLIYGDFLQVNQFVKSGDPLFYVNTAKDDYYGEMLIPQSTSAKVREKQQVIIKVRSFPYQEYGYLKGEIDYISDIPLRDSVFLTKVTLIRTPKDSIIKLKPGIQADAEIITEDKSIFYRIWSNITKSLKF